MPKMSFKCKECGEKIVIKEPGFARCEECGSLYKAFFEIKKKRVQRNSNTPEAAAS